MKERRGDLRIGFGLSLVVMWPCVLLWSAVLLKPMAMVMMMIILASEREEG